MFGLTPKKFFQKYLSVRQEPFSIRSDTITPVELIAMSEYLQREAQKVSGRVVAHDIRNALSSIEIALPFVQDKELHTKLKSKSDVIKNTLQLIDEKSDNKYTFVKIKEIGSELKEISNLVVEDGVLNDEREVLMQVNAVVFSLHALIAVISAVAKVGSIEIAKDQVGLRLKAEVSSGAEEFSQLMLADGQREFNSEQLFYHEMLVNLQKILAFNRISLTPEVSARGISVVVKI